MEQQIQNILAQDTTKTNKIKQLIQFGLTRKQIAQLVTNGNYGFVQNVYAKMRAQGLLNHLGTIIAVAATFTRRFGVEFEAYNVPMQTLSDALNRAGVNCRVEGYIQELEKVCRVLNECGAKVNKSCGTHIHMDAQRMPLQTWKNIYKNYARLEDVIDAFMPASRRDNAYCHTFKNYTNLEARIDAARSLDGIASIFHHNRYHKINPVSYSRHNTCEFRQHSGTVEFEKISTWVRFLNNLIDYSASHLISRTTLEGLREFNNEDIVNYYKTRTNKFAGR